MGRAVAVGGEQRLHPHDDRIRWRRGAAQTTAERLGAALAGRGQRSRRELGDDGVFGNELLGEQAMARRHSVGRTLALGLASSRVGANELAHQ